MISLKQEPGFISASENPIVITLTEDDTNVTAFDYTTYIRIYRVGATNIKLSGSDKLDLVLLKSLAKLSKSRDVSYDLSNILRAQFTEWSAPVGKPLLWKDPTATFGYYLEFGEIGYSATQQLVYTPLGETEVKWCVRGMFDADTSVAERTAFHNVTLPAIPLNYVPADSEQSHNTLIYFPFLLPIPINQESGYGCKLYANLSYADGVKESNKVIAADVVDDGGVYTYNLLPSLLVPDPLRLANLSGVELWVGWEELTTNTGGGSTYAFVSTATRTASCEPGYVGSNSTRTATATSNVTQADADQQAATAALAAATAALRCSLQYTSTQSYTAECGPGLLGVPVTKSATATSLVSQVDADAKALAAAKTSAQAALKCATAPVFTGNKQYTATCATAPGYGEGHFDANGDYVNGYVGIDTTRSATETSTISQADADDKALAKAKAQAEADLVCELQVWGCYYGGMQDTYQCFRDMMQDQFGNQRACTQDEGRRCWVSDDGHGPGTCGLTNPY